MRRGCGGCGDQFSYHSANLTNSGHGLYGWLVDYSREKEKLWAHDRS